MPGTIYRNFTQVNCRPAQLFYFYGVTTHLLSQQPRIACRCPSRPPYRDKQRRLVGKNRLDRLALINPSPILLREGFCFVFCTEERGQCVSSGLAVGHYQLVARHNGFEVS